MTQTALDRLIGHQQLSLITTREWIDTGLQYSYGPVRDVKAGLVRIQGSKGQDPTSAHPRLDREAYV
ncbi:hypothetical protein GCM10009681_14780 [Luedemannella helvata]|uniref:Uncharacterized protein n=1 Tax=Luedemannella helvata TaxID=349315 RepID=A0ABP4W3T0_9ACTN